MFFEADPAQIASLDSVTLVRLMKRLMLAESRQAGIPLRNTAAPLQITVPDGGEDGRIEWVGDPSDTAYLPHRFTLFQSKAQNLKESTVKAEVLKKPKKGPPKLNAALTEVLAKGGAFVVFCQKPFGNQKRSRLVEAIKAAIVEGGGDPKNAAAIEVYDANLIADWVNAHPPVALWLASLKLGSLHSFLSHESWAHSPEISTVPWMPSDAPRFTPVNRSIPVNERVNSSRNAWTFRQAAEAVLNFLTDDRMVVRVAGPSGFGKTRFVHEVLGPGSNVADEADSVSVIYSDGSNSGEDAVKLALAMADAGTSAILVVDECADELHNKLAQMVQRENSRLRLITMDIETRVLRANDTLTLRVDKADDEHIQSIAKGVAPTLSDADSRFISDLANGFPRMAVLAARQNGDGRQTAESIEQFLDRVIWGRKAHTAGAQKALEIASLFEWLGIQGRVADQVAFVAGELGDMPTTEFVEHLLSFRLRGILTQRGDFAQIGPAPLAARLGLRRLSVLSAEQLLAFFDRASDELKASLLTRLRWLDISPTAQAFVRQLFAPSLLGNFAALNTEFGSKCLDRVVHIDPGFVAATVDRVFGDLTIDELKAVKNGRRYLVWALEKLVFRKASFDRSARLLRRLATAENETWASNATGEFRQLYQLYLSGTEAEPSARLLVLEEGLASDNLREREICVEALGEMLGTDHFSRSGGAEHIGSGERLQDWTPRTYGEIWKFHRIAINRLTDIAVDNGPLALKAKELLGLHIRGLIHHMPLIDVTTMIDSITAHFGLWPEALSGISDWLYYDSKGGPQDVVANVRAYFDRLLPTDPVELAILYTYGWQTDFHDPDARYDSAPDAKHDFEYASRQATLIAEQIAQNDDLVSLAVERLACSDAKTVFPFALQLARSVSDSAALFAFAVRVAESNDAVVNRLFFSGLISGAAELDSNLAKSFVRAALESPKLKGEAITLIGSGPFDADDMALVISLLQNKDIQPWQCVSLAYGNRVTLDLFLPLLEALTTHGYDGLWTILDIVSAQLHGREEQPAKPIIWLLKRVLLEPELFDKTRTNLDGYHLEQVVEYLAKLEEITPTYAKSLCRQLLRICQDESHGLFYELDDPVRKVLGTLMTVHPKVVWNEVAKKLTSKSREIRFYAERLLAAAHREDHLSKGLAFYVQPEIYLEWVYEKPEERAAIAVAWLPIATKSEDGCLSWDRELTDFVQEFGNQPRVLLAISRRLHPTSWWGPLSGYLEPLVPLLETWRSHRNPNVRRWADAQIDWLRETIATETKRSEEDIVRFS